MKFDESTRELKLRVHIEDNVLNQRQKKGKTEDRPKSKNRAKMASLLKFYNPLTFTRFSPFSVSQAILRRTHHNSHCSFFNSARNFTCLTASPSSSQHLIREQNHKEIGGVRHERTSLELWLHNTMSRKRELFKPKVEGKVGMYVCGVTAYDLSHIGHARVYVTFDVLYR